ncbi:hypothetical protein Plhal304r1_c045g0125731 [Plasmopara halstedii]
MTSLVSYPLLRCGSISTRRLFQAGAKKTSLIEVITCASMGMIPFLCRAS